MRKGKPSDARESKIIPFRSKKVATARKPPKTPVALVKINKCFAVVTGGQHGGRIVDLSQPSQPQFLTKERFRTRFENRDVSIDGKMVPLSIAWLRWKDRREITDLVFEPDGSPNPVPDGAHNMWQGFAVSPKKGSSHIRLLRHIRDNVCHGDKELYAWFLAWLADLVQRPGDKPGIAVALKGEYGAGKSVIYQYLREIFGAHATSIDKESHLTGHFNAHMAGCVLLGVEEGFWAGRKSAESTLKNLITSEQIMMEQKGVDPTPIHNHLHILMTSNEDWVVPAGLGDRRWAVFEVSPARKDDKRFWVPAFEALRADGPAHLLHYLLNYKYDPNILFRPPMTRAKAEQTLKSMSTVDHWWFEILRDDRSLGDEIFGMETPKSTIYDDYKSWCEENKRRPDSQQSFWKALRSRVGTGLKEKRGRHGKKRMRDILLPPQVQCREAFAKAMGCPWSELEAL